MKTKILKDPRVKSLEQWRDDSGRTEGWTAHLKPGFHCDGLSFVRGETLAKVLAEIPRIKKGKPF